MASPSRLPCTESFLPIAEVTLNSIYFSGVPFTPRTLHTVKTLPEFGTKLVNKILSPSSAVAQKFVRLPAKLLMFIVPTLAPVLPSRQIALLLPRSLITTQSLVTAIPVTILVLVIPTSVSFLVQSSLALLARSPAAIFSGISFFTVYTDWVVPF